MQISSMACAFVIIISLLFKGLVGGFLYKVAVPALAYVFDNMPVDIATRKDSWLEPALFVIPIIWALGLLPVALIYQKLERLDWTNLTVKTSYVVIMIAWNLVLWLALFAVVSPL